jgi:hypothetical protein
VGSTAELSKMIKNEIKTIDNEWKRILSW